MARFRDVILRRYERTWGARKSGNRDRLVKIQSKSPFWSPDSSLDFTEGEVDWGSASSDVYTRATQRIRKVKLNQWWTSKRLKARFGTKEPTDEFYLRRYKVLQRRYAKVASRGPKSSVTWKQCVAAVLQNNLYVNGTTQDESTYQSNVWFSEEEGLWKPGFQCILNINNVQLHPALVPLYTNHPGKALDAGLSSLTFSQPMYVDASVPAEATETRPPILQGSHYYVPFAFGTNLQAAVAHDIPLVLINAPDNPGRWRSTPFALNFADISLPYCVLHVATEVVEDVCHTTCYLFGADADRYQYYCELGNDNAVLRWNLWLKPELDFNPQDVHDTDSEQNRFLAGQEDDFFLDSDATYPGLEDPARFDSWLGGDAWRSGAFSSQVYASLTNPQFLHLQFGVALGSHKVTDAALVLRGTPTVNEADPALTYCRSLFRIVVGQPHDDQLRRIDHESHLRMMIGANLHNGHPGIACEGYFIPDEQGVLNLRPAIDANIPALLEWLQITLPAYPGPRVSQLTLLLHAATGQWRVLVANDDHFEFTADGPPLI